MHFTCNQFQCFLQTERERSALAVIVLFLGFYFFTRNFSQLKVSSILPFYNHH